MRLTETVQEIARLERVIPLLTNLGDVNIQERRLATLRADRDALTTGATEAVAA